MASSSKVKADCASSNLKRNKYERIVLLIDMDCFYCQVEEKLNPTLRGLPIAVVQYNAWRGGGIIAVNYAARAKGVTRHMRGDEAKAQCPDIELVKVPNVREKADLSKYRDAGKDVANVLQQFSSILERASVDEAYLDITQLVNERLNKMNSGSFVLRPQELISTYAVGYENIGQYVSEITSRLGQNRQDNANIKLHEHYAPEDILHVNQLDIRLLIGASISNEIRAAVKAQTDIECSAGIAHNKIVAKLACGMNKPNKQTILPLSQIPQLFDTLPLGKIKGLGGKFGEKVCEIANVTFLGQLRDYTEEQLQRKFDEKNGTWLYNICRGIDFEAVIPRFYSKSIGCCKRFPGKNCITGLETLQHWLHELAGEISDRLEKDVAENSRRPKQMVVSFTQEFNDGEDVPSSRSMTITQYDQEYLERNCLEVIKANTNQFLQAKNDNKLNNAIKFLGISVGKFETISRAQSSLLDMFAQQTAKQIKSNENDKIKASDVEEEASENTITGDDKKISTAADPLKTKTTSQKHNIGKNTINGSLQKSFFSKYLQKYDTNKSSPSSSDLTIKPTCDSNNEPHDNTTIENKKNGIENKQNDKPTIYAQIVQSAKRKSADDKLESSEDKRRKYTEKKEQEEEFEIFDDVKNNSSEEEEKLNCIENDDRKNYQDNYAEFAIPEVSSELLNFITCEECHKEIPADERSIQLHKDSHFAYKLSQELRQEYQREQNNQLNKSIASNHTNNNKNIKNPTKSNSSGINNDISKFLKPKSPKAITNNCDNLELCPKCDEFIAKSTLVEHLDFHMAMELQKEVNKTTSYNHPSTSKKIDSKLCNNNKNNKKTAVKESVIAKPISTFFTKP